MAEKKKREPKKWAEHYEKSDLKINGIFDEAMKVFFIKPKDDKRMKPRNEAFLFVSSPQ